MFRIILDKIVFLMLLYSLDARLSKARFGQILNKYKQKFESFSMLIKDKIAKIPLFSLIFCLFLGGFFVFGPEARAWTEPTAAPPGGNVAAPINVSATTQTKIGTLNIGSGGTLGIIKLNPGTLTANPCETGQVAYNSADNTVYYCKNTAWTSLAAGAAGDYVVLDLENAGWTTLKPTDDSGSRFAVSGYAPPTLSSGRTTGIFGTTASLVTGGTQTYGVWGQAVCNDNRCSGIYGSALGDDSYAGYFYGDVRIENGGLWLGGVFRDTWPTSGSGGYWSQNNVDTYVTNLSSNLAVGGTSSADAKFYVKATNKGSVIIGQPGDLEKKPPDTIYTCGDGACNNNETNATCTQDCPPTFTSPPGITVTNIKETSAVINWQSTEDHYGKVEYDFDITDNQWSYYKLAPLLIPENTAYSLPLSGLTKNLTYSYRVIIWDIYGNYTYGETKTFKTLNSAYYCGDGICGVPETCQSCPADCANKFALAGRCPINQWCMDSDPITNPCDDGDGSIGGTSYDCCVYCITSANCPAGGKCCAPSYQCKKSCGPGETETGFISD
ncbi:MAG: fibronectin type III domain-containing protein [Patescibacteria group bacterium]